MVNPHTVMWYISLTWSVEFDLSPGKDLYNIFVKPKKKKKATNIMIQLEYIKFAGTDDTCIWAM